MRLLTRIRKWTEIMRDHKLNREYVGRDKFGNKYYQYYSFLGLPTRRECEFVDWERLKPFRDTAYFWWMNKNDNLPPSDQDLKLYYDQERERKAKAIAWDKQQKELDVAFYARRTEIGETWGDRKFRDEFEVEEWNPNVRKGWKEVGENFDNKKLE